MKETTDLTSSTLDEAAAAGSPVVVSGKVEPVVVPAAYRVALAAVAVGMLLLPLTYLALTFLAALGTIGYAAFVVPRLGEIPSLQGKFLVGFGPPIGGTLLVYFMVRSMWPRRRQTLPGLVVDQGEAPGLHELVRGIADALDAPRPHTVRVDLEVNASAALRRGLLSLFRRDLVLTVGLPLAAGLDTRQLAGVVAHELGHFAQRGGMGVYYVIRTVNSWFARVVYERSSLDAELERQSSTGSVWVRAAVRIAQFFLWLCRQVLTGLMTLGTALSAALSRQMEYDADRYEARLVGARTATTTLAELQRLAVAGHAAWSEVGMHWREGRLADDLPSLVRDHRLRLPNELLETLDKAHADEVRSWRDLHPTSRERDQNLAGEQVEGMFADERPASRLFADFGGLCRKATVAAYRERLGKDVEPERLIGVAEFQAYRAGEKEEVEALTRRFGMTLSRRRPLPLDLEDAVSGDRTALAAELELLEAEAAAERAAVEGANESFARLDERLDRLEGLVVLAAAGVPRRDWGDSVQVMADLAGAETPEAAAAATRAERDTLRGPLEDSDRRAGRRLALALAVSSARGNFEDGRRAEEIRAVAAALARLDSTLDLVGKLRLDVTALEIIWSPLVARKRDPGMLGWLEGRYLDVRSSLEKLHRLLHDAPNPLSADERAATLQRFVVPEVPDDSEPAAVVGAARETIERAVELRLRCLARLATLAETPNETPSTARA